MVCCNTSPASLTIKNILLFLLFSCVGYHLIVLKLLEDYFKLVKEDADKQNHRIEVLELQTTNLNDEVKLLKSNSENYQNTINHLMGESKQEDNLLSIYGRQQRAARLIPASLLVNKKDEKVLDPHKPPSSCDDLNELGHTLNGIYLLNGKNNNSKIEVAFCDFQFSKSKTSVMEKRVGFIDVKASPGGVYFYCQGANPENKHAEIRIRSDLPPVKPGLRCESIKLNLGSGINDSTGIFTAPKPGVYHFQFFAQKHYMTTNAAVVHLRCNGRKEAASVTSSGLYKYPVVIQSTLKLKKGDKVDIFLEFGSLDHSLPSTIHFSGFLLEEDVLLK